MWLKKKTYLFTSQQACTGICSTGRPGGGKTTFLRRLVVELAEQGCKVLVCCVKPDEADAYCDLLKGYGVKRFSPDTGVFNPISYELGRKGGSTRSLARFHDDLNTVLTRSSSDRAEAFWISLINDTLTNAIELVYMVKGAATTYSDVYNLIMSSPVDMAHAGSTAFAESTCGKILNDALLRHGHAAMPMSDFFLRQLSSVGEKARGAAITGATASIAPFLYGDIAKAVNGASTITPDDILNGVTVLDFDTLTYNVNGLAFQLIMSWFCMEACLRRRGKFPYFVLVRDEYHCLASPERDIQTQSTGRSQRFIGISAFQSIPVLESALGGTMEATTQAKALYGLHVNKVMVNNNCHHTNELNSMALGQERKMFFGGAMQPNNEKPPEWWDVLGVGQQQSFSFNQQWHYRVPPTAFLNLRTGGAECNYLVDAIVHRGHDSFEFQTISQR